MKKTFAKKHVFVIIILVFLLKKHMRDAKILAISNIPKHNQTTEEFKLCLQTLYQIIQIQYPFMNLKPITNLTG